MRATFNEVAANANAASFLMSSKCAEETSHGHGITSTNNVCACASVHIVVENVNAARLCLARHTPAVLYAHDVWCRRDVIAAARSAHSNQRYRVNKRRSEQLKHAPTAR